MLLRISKKDSTIGIEENVTIDCIKLVLLLLSIATTYPLFVVIIMRKVHHNRGLPILLALLAIAKQYLLGVDAFSSSSPFRHHRHCGSAASSSKDARCIVVLEESANDNNNEDNNNNTMIPATRQRKRDVVRGALKRLATLSLKDYEWRSDVFKTNEANRGVEESLARMMGEDSPSYVRPMDASEESRGPLGKAEKEAVAWLGSVIEEEGKRAKQIADSEGELVRPIDAGDGEGPLAKLEGAAVDFVESIRESETERVRSLGKISRPKDLDETKRGPLGDAEARIVRTVEEIAKSEKIRMEMTKKNKGREVVRPIDVPGPMGELEARVVEAVKAEKLRAKERKDRDMRRLRPMNATIPGPLGNAERNAMESLERLKEEEKERLKNVERFIKEKGQLEESGPGDDDNTRGGLAETFAKGLLRVGKAIDRANGFVSAKLSSSQASDTKPLPSPGTKKIDGDDKQTNQKQE